MTEIELSLLAALKELDASARSAGQGGARPDFQELFARIDSLGAQLPPETARDLGHYLRKRSYEKALLWLEQRQSEISRGGCRED